MSKREEIIKLYFLEGEIPADIAKKLEENLRKGGIFNV